MQLNKTELLHALNAVKPGLANNSIIKQMENATFTGEDMITYNDQICVLYPFKTDFTASVNHKDILKVVSKIPSEIVDIDLDNGELRIQAEHTRSGLATIANDEFMDNINSLTEQLNHSEWTPLPDDFIPGALLCIPAAATDTATTLDCLYVNGSDLLCSDNLRVSWYKLGTSVNTKFFIKATLLKELAPFAFKQFAVSETWVHFQADDGTVFSVRKIKGKDVDFFKEVFDGFQGDPIKLPDGLKELVESASVMAADELTRDMVITFANGKIMCSTESSRGWIEKEMPVDYQNQIQFMISATYLQQILGMPLQMTVGENKSLFEYNTFKHVLIHKVA